MVHMETASTTPQPDTTAEPAAELAELIRLVLTSDRRHATLNLHHLEPAILRSMFACGVVHELETQSADDNSRTYLVGRVRLAGVCVNVFSSTLPDDAPELTREVVADAFRPGG